MNTPLILGIVGSPRSRHDEEGIRKLVSEIEDEFMLESVIEKVARDQVLSNTEVCLMASLFGAKKSGLDFRVINLKNYVRAGSMSEPEKLAKLVNAAKGMIIASPVYFGDRSYLIDSFMSFMKRRSLLKEKIVGAISVGAKRNGGQETTNIFVLKEATDAGAYAVGNGPPTSQYGGTAWAGNLGAIREDEFGIMTAVGTGKRVANVASLLSARGGLSKEALRLAFWVVRDHNNLVLDEVKRISEYANKNVGFKVKCDVINFTTMNFHTCQACTICPFHKDRKTLYKCRIKKDDFVDVYERLVKTDAILVCGYNPSHSKDVKDIYMKTLERTRCIRRDNFLLTNVPITSFSFENLPGGSLFPIQVMTSFLRHNSILYPSLNAYLSDDEELNSPEKAFLGFVNFAMKIKKAGGVVKVDQPPVYLPIGYAKAAHGELPC